MAARTEHWGGGVLIYPPDGAAGPPQFLPANASSGGLEFIGGPIAGRGIQAFGQVSNMLRGTGLHAHHLLPRRFAALLGENANKMLSIPLTPAEHQVFTNAWRQAFSYGIGTAEATATAVRAQAQRIYADYPEILRALGLSR